MLDCEHRVKLVFLVLGIGWIGASWFEFKAVNIYEIVYLQSHGITPLGVLPLIINL